MLLLRCFSHVRLCATPEMTAHQAPLSLGFSRQEHWSGLPFPSPLFYTRDWQSVVKFSQPGFVSKAILEHSHAECLWSTSSFALQQQSRRWQSPHVPQSLQYLICREVGQFMLYAMEEHNILFWVHWNTATLAESWSVGVRKFQVWM